VLIEGSRTNLLLRSQEINNASWSKTNITVTTDAIAAPDGTTTADLLTVTATGSTFAIQDVVVSATAGSYSFFIKAGNIVNATTDFLFQDITAVVTRASCALTWATMTVTGTGASIVALANGWYRITMASASLVSGNTMRCWIGNGGSMTIAHSFYFWGAQLEAASFASSYVPTTSAAVTRAADVLTYTAGVSYPTSLWAEFERAVDTGGNEVILSVYETTNDISDLRVSSSDQAQAVMQDGGVTQASPQVAGALATATAYEAAARFNANSVQIARGGTLGTEGTVATLPNTPTFLSIGAFGGTVAPMFGYIRRAAIFNSALTDAQLTASTT
jgi:hypothetical protein